MKSKLITRNEAAEIIGSTRQTVQNWIAKGVLHARTIGNSVYLNRDEIEALIGDLGDVEKSRAILMQEQEEIDALRKQEEEELHQLRIEMKVLPACVEAGLRASFLSSVLDMAGEPMNYRERNILYDILTGKSVGSVSDYYGITRERVRQIGYKAIRKAGELINLSETVKENKRLSNELSEANITISLLRGELSKYKDVEEKYGQYNNLTAILAVSVYDIGISTRLMNAFKAMGIKTLYDAVQLTEEDYSNTRNFGKRSLMEIKELFKKYGLTFGMIINGN